MFSTPFTTDYGFWRDTFNADSTYPRNYVDRLSEDESLADYEARLRTTPSPTQARQIADKVLAAFRDRMRFATRYGELLERVETGRGVDNNGGAMANYIQSLARELAINGKVAVSVDRLAIPGRLPYLVTVPAEDLGLYEYAGPDGESILQSVEWSEERGKVRWWIDGGKAMYQVAEGEPVNSGLTVIPVVIVTGGGIIPLIAQHQRLLANLLSVAGAESPRLLETFLTRQRGFFDAAHSRGFDDGIEVGRSRGLWYGTNENTPTIVGPPAAPATEARQWVAAIIEGMESLAGLAGATEAERAQALARVAGGLGGILFAAERQIAAMLAMFVASSTAYTVKYPQTWQSQTTAERTVDIATLYANAQLAPGRAGMEEATILAVEQQFACQPSAIIRAAIAAVKSAPCLLNDATSIIRAFEAKILPTAVACDALGCTADVADKALAEAAERAQALAAAAAMAAATKQADRTVGGVGSDRDGELASKQIAQVEGDGDTRGENR